VYGGSLGGVLASYTLAKSGKKTLLIEQTKWIGGQLTNQGVPLDEHPFIEETGCSNTYRKFRDSIRTHYRNNPSIKEMYRNKKVFNPGGGWVTRLAFQPQEALTYFENLLKPFVERGTLTILTETIVNKAIKNSNIIKGVHFNHQGEDFYAEAKYFIDATDLGDLLPLTKTKYFTGAESFSETNEPSAPQEADPLDMQPITWVCALGFSKNNKIKIDKPSQYDFFKNQILPFNKPLLSWYVAGLDNKTYRKLSFLQPSETAEGLFHYRKIIDKTKFEEGYFPYDVSLINWPQNDYIFGNIIEVTNKEENKKCAQELTLSLAYWLQNEAPRDDGGIGYPEVFLVPEILGTKSGLALAPYIRESRRIKALYTIKEHEIAKKHAKKAPNYFDSVGVGLYPIDLHMTINSKTHLYEDVYPFQIPLGALIPVETVNLIAGAKNIGTTHLTNGCYRLHPVEWNIGESAGHFVSFCLDMNLTPKQIYQSEELIKQFQEILILEGVQLKWDEKYLVK